MSYTNDAAEQVVRLTLEGTEVAARITGAGAKNLAVLLYAVLREQKKTKGKARLESMLRSGKELKVFAVKDADLKKFAEESRNYGIVYCILKNRNATDGITDIMVRAEDASKVNRIFERFNFATVDLAEIKAEIERSRAAKVGETPEAPERAEAAKPSDSKANPTKEEQQTANPTEGRNAKSRQSEPTSPRKNGAKDTTKRSVRKELTEIREAQASKSKITDHVAEAAAKAAKDVLTR